MIPRLAVIVAALLALLSLMPTAVSASGHETEVRITAQRLADGRTEFALQERETEGGWGERLLPSSRFFPATSEVGRWLSSTPLAAGGAAEVRIAARPLADSRIEFALQQRSAGGDWSERLLPNSRFFPVAAEVGRWLSSSPLTVRAPDATDAEGALFEVRISAQRLADGRTEFALQQRAGDGWGERQEPRSRFFPVAAEVGRWLSSTPLALSMEDEWTEVRITARRLGDSRIEFALQQRGEGWGERLLPRSRFFPARVEPGRWLSSTPLTVRVPDRAPTTGSAASDRAALVEFYNATGRASWLTNWGSQLPLGHWARVTTNAEGRVTRLEIEGFPTQINVMTFSGGIVTDTTVAGKPLTGPLPTVLGNLSNLEVLSVWGHQLTGSIPRELVNLTQLEYLNLSSNGLTGSIPTELARLDRLEQLQLGNNALTGPIPPEIGNLTDLSRLGLGGNDLSGPVPSELGNLAGLYWLDLAENDLSGDVPPELGNLTELQTFHVGGNQLTGCIPGTLGRTGESGLRFCERAEDRAALVALYEATGGANWVYSTNWLSDHDMDDWHGVRAYLGTVTHLDLRGNNLNGPIPPELGDLANLERLKLVGNHLTGPIPPELGRLTRLQLLDLENQGLTGAIPRELGDLADLWHLDLKGNDLSGPIPPELGNLTNLRELRLNENGLTGPIPPQLGKLANLTLLDLAVNQLTGHIPPELGNLGNLEWAYLNVNQLTGPIPPELEGMTNLRHLVLSWNQLSGAIPSELEHLANLEALGLEGNHWTGCVPTGLPSWGQYAPTACDAVGDRAALVALYEATDGANWNRNANWLSDRPLWEWEGVKTDHGYVTELQLTNNGLSGQIPPEIGNLAGLMHLVLSANQLTGLIPPEMGNLMRLTWLSLDFNQMSGPIPPELGNLTELRILHLGNDFTGCLPAGLPPFSNGPPYCSE